MLKALTIQDLAIVRHLDLEFHAGLTVITGETGAGKSIVIEALGLVLGDRADSMLVRSGAPKATISATFEISARPALLEFLTDNGLDTETDCILRRVIGSDGRSRAFCNGAPVTVQVLKDIGAHLVDIHGQHEHHSLLQRAEQRRLLDQYGELLLQVATVRAAFSEWRTCCAELNTLTGGETDAAARADYLRFQMEELNAVGVSGDVLAGLDAEHRRLAHGQRLREGCEEIASRVFDHERAAYRVLNQARNTVRELTAVDGNLRGLADNFDQILIGLSEAERDLAHYRQQLGADDPVALQRLEQRLQQVHDLCRKHRCDSNALPALLIRLNEELTNLESRGTRITELTRALDSARGTFDMAATALSAGRERVARAMADVITANLHQLGMPQARFEVAITASPEPAQHGRDEIDLLVTTNPDQGVQPLRRVASGGELSRISLAIQVATAAISSVSTLVYDEIDTGIGGRVASSVAKHLQAVARARQVLCITHLAQVASAGEHHLFITKAVTEGITNTQATYLGAEDRVEEIARMLGGEQLTARSRAHAKELLTG